MSVSQLVSIEATKKRNTETLIQGILTDFYVSLKDRRTEFIETVQVSALDCIFVLFI